MGMMKPLKQTLALKAFYIGGTQAVYVSEKVRYPSSYKVS